MSKMSLYFHTVKSMKPSQVYLRLKKMAGMKCSLGCKVQEFDKMNIRIIPPLVELDYDKDFLARFPVNEFIEDKVSFLHSSRIFRWNERWECQNQTALWNFNLHYFEYLFPLADAYRKTGNTAYYEKARQCITSWIQWNPVQEGGSGWSPYTVALRLTIWLDYYAIMEPEIKKDTEFQKQFLESMHEQYEFLSNHLEKDLLGNHYFEDLKTLVLCSLFFKDDKFFKCVLKEFKSQCREQILEDGMHFELSPMYHKIILEDMLRVAWGLKATRMPDQEIEGYIQPMLDAAFSLEEGLERVPLFNDSGNNVSKSLEALIKTAEQYFHIKPHYKNQFPASGYYIFKQDDWKLIVDAGQPGPAYISGHAHCDAMSFELFKNGKPVIVNCGTYAYQDEKRPFFRSTVAHNTVMLNGVEQSQCWGTFRLAKRARVYVEKVEKNYIVIRMVDQKKLMVQRKIEIKQGLLNITDTSKGQNICGFLHCIDTEIKYKTSGNIHEISQAYAPDFGTSEYIQALSYEDENSIECTIYLIEKR